MKVIYHGFDGLEFAIKASLTEEMCGEFSAAQELAKENDEFCALKVGDEWLHIHSTGARGGYAYRLSHASTGTWFFKKHSLNNDAWGVRFSAASHALAISGLEGLRQKCAALLLTLGIKASDSDYRPSRADFAVDFIIPNFEPKPENFVINSQTNRKGISEIEGIETNAKSNRITSITVGKMPNRQVIIYDKSLEANIRRKGEWPLIWRQNVGSELDGARVWRVELRIAKRHFKDVWNVDGWASFYELLKRILQKLLNDIRYCEPNAEAKRARWTVHPIWQEVSRVASESLFDHIPTLTPDKYVEVKREQKIDELQKQALGLLISTAAIEDVKSVDLEEFLINAAKSLAQTAQTSNPPLEQKIARAKARYIHLV
ncbi:MAG: hypothetical protein WBC85_13050 [Planktotalea sp.]|uniref:hypothetical protein n=1 Tax=Planktotalea sp. TaxID=2029877 RepID=UPI003C7894E7